MQKLFLFFNLFSVISCRSVIFRYICMHRLSIHNLTQLYTLLYQDLCIMTSWTLVSKKHYNYYRKYKSRKVKFVILFFLKP